ncbi:MAG: glycosyltransferase [Spirochaetes bacterium]|nr:glycosyltransferase [Spirochaetota bacterium]
MNIALFTDCYLPIKNGVVTSVMQLKEGLESKGHNVIVIAPEVPNYIDKDKNIYRLPSVKLGLGTEQRFAFYHQGPINRFLKKKNIDIVHSHTEFSIGQCGKKAAKKLKIPIIHTTHTMWEDYTHYIFNGKLLTKSMSRKILINLLKNINCIIAPSIKAKKYYQQLLPNTPIQIIHNGIDQQNFIPTPVKKSEINQLRKEFDLKKNDKILIFVGRIGKEKRVNELFDAVVPVIKKTQNTKMIFVGEGPILKDLIKKKTELHLNKDIIFTGFVNWELIYRLYYISNIFITTSLSEVHPMTMIEACICKLPIIARRDDSYLDLVQNGKNGYLVDSDSELTDRIIELLNNCKKLEEFSENSYYISQSFKAESHVNKVENLYKKVINLYPDKLNLLLDNVFIS